MTDPKRPSKPDDPGRGAERVLERPPETRRPPMYRCILHNDDYTTMEFVVWVLQVVFHKSESEATHLMLAIHHKGQGVAGVFTRDIAETKAAQAMSLAEENGMPLQCSVEPDP